MIEAWQGVVCKSKLTNYIKFENVDPSDFFGSFTVKNELAAHVELLADNGLIVEFWYSLVDTYQRTDSDTLEAVCNSNSPAFKHGDRLIVYGTSKKNYGYKVIIDVIEVIENPRNSALKSINNTDSIMLETWVGKVILSEFCQLGNYTVPGTENVIKSESAIRYQIQTNEGLIVDFCRRSLDSFQAPGSNVVRIIPYPMEAIYRIGDEIIVTGKLIQQCDSKITIECTEITEDPAKYPE